jgi:protoheme IX farnesyltransferase
MTPRAAVRAAARSSPLALAGDLAALAKPRLLGLVVCTAAGGAWLAPGGLDLGRALALLLGTSAVVGGANALNEWLERDVDARMRRTCGRPLPAGRLEPWVAVALGFALPGVALPALAWTVNGLTATLAALALFLYAVVYTPLKRVTPAALFVGAIPGAIPPLMGWTGVTGRVDAGGLALFGVLFFWQLPHFLAVSIYLKDDYARGGLKVFALARGERAAVRWAVATSALLVPVTLLPVPLGLAGPAYGAAAAALGAGLVAWAATGLRTPSIARWARGFFLSTLAYLTLLLAALFTWAR